MVGIGDPTIDHCGQNHALLEVLPESVVLDGPGGRAVIMGHAAWTRREYEAGVPVGDAFKPRLARPRQASVDRLRSLHPVRLWFSHEAQPYDP